MAEITEQIVRESPQIEAYKLGLLQAAKEQIARPLAVPAYQTAAMTPEQVTAAQMAMQGIGTYAPYLTQGSQAIQGGIGALGYGTQFASQLPQYATAAGARASDVATGATTLSGAVTGLTEATKAYSPTGYKEFFNPYQEAVTKEAMKEYDRQAQIAQQAASAQAVRAGAFGGTREGVQRAELGRNLADIKSQRMAQDLAANYAQAQQAAMGSFEAQQQRRLGAVQAAGALGAQQAQLGLLPAQIAGQQASILGQGAQLYGQLGQGLGTLGVQQGALGETAAKLGQSDISFLFGLGEQQRQIQQQGLEAQRATALQQAMTPYQQLGFLSDIYKGAPSSQISVTGQTAPTTSPLLQAAGLGISGLATAAGASRAGLFG